LTQVTYRSPTSDDIVKVAAEMRLADVMEVAASHGHSPIDAVIEAVKVSSAAFAVIIDGTPAAVFGFVHRGGMSAEVWMLGTDLLTRNVRLFRKESKRIIDSWAEQFPLMHNFVDDENEAAKRWLTSVGFKMDEPRPYGVGRLPFRYFWRVGV